MRLPKILNRHKYSSRVSEFFKYVGPGLLVTVGFIDPGNWASNVAAGATYGYSLLWVVTLSTIMLIFLQHNAAHIGIVSGKCLAEATYFHFKPKVANTILGSSIIAAISTAFAELLGGAIALKMLFNIPIKLGAILVFIFVSVMLFSNSYKKLERWIIAFVSLVGISFLIELFMVNADWAQVAISTIVPSTPIGSIPLVLGMLGAIVMPHNLFLHSEIIQSREWNLENENVIEHQLKYEFFDTAFSMVIGWAINSAMIIVAAATFFVHGTQVDSLEQAQTMLIPILGRMGGFAGLVFAIALLFAAISAAITAGFAGGSMFSGIFGEPYNAKDLHTKIGIFITLFFALVAIFFINDTLTALIWSQILLSIQLPITILTQIHLTSNPKVMGKYINKGFEKYMLYLIATVVIALNLVLLYSIFSAH